MRPDGRNASGRPPRRGPFSFLAGWVRPGDELVRERRWYSTVGATILIPTAVAAISGTVFATMQFAQTWPLNACTGAAWALLVGLVDTLIVRQVRYPELGGRASAVLTGFGALATFLLRVALSGIVAILVTEPLILNMFHDVIAVQVAADVDRSAKVEQLRRLTELVHEAQALRDDAAGQQDALAGLDRQRLDLEARMATELHGTSAVTGQRGAGRVYQSLLREWNRVRAQLKADQKNCRTFVGRARVRLNATHTAIDESLPRLRKDAESKVAFLSKQIALTEIEEIAAGGSAGGGGTSADVSAQVDAAERAYRGTLAELPGCVPTARSADTAAATAASVAAHVTPTGLPGADPTTAASAAAGSDIAGVSRQQAIEVRRQHWLWAALLVIVDLLPLSVKVFGGWSPYQVRVVEHALPLFRSLQVKRSEMVREAALRRLTDRRHRLTERVAWQREQHQARLHRLARYRQLGRVLIGRLEVPLDLPVPPPRPGPRPAPTPTPAPGPDPDPAPGPDPDPAPGPDPGPAPGPDPDPGRLAAAAWPGWVCLQPLPGSSYARLYRARREDEPDDTAGRFLAKEFPLHDDGTDPQPKMDELKVSTAIYLKHRNNLPLPYIAPVVDVLVSRPSTTGSPLLGLAVTPFYELGDLASLLRRMGSQTYSPHQVVALALQMAKGLTFAHIQLKLVHNDVKPGNIVLDDSAASGLVVRLIDWGISGLQGGGTPFYAPPERWRPGQGRMQSSLTDVYGLGATMYWMLTGRAPLTDLADRRGLTQGDERLRGFLAEGLTPTPVTQLAPEIPPELAILVGEWLDPDSGRRVRGAQGRFVQPGDDRDAMAYVLGKLEYLVRSGGYTDSLQDAGLTDCLTRPIINLASESGRVSWHPHGGGTR